MGLDQFNLELDYFPISTHRATFRNFHLTKLKLLTHYHWEVGSRLLKLLTFNFHHWKYCLVNKKVEQLKINNISKLQNELNEQNYVENLIT